MRTSAAILTALIIITTVSSAQNFTKVIEIVGGMEETMKGLISREERTRKEEIAALRTDLNSLREVIVRSADGSEPAAVASAGGGRPVLERLEVLEARLPALETSKETEALAVQLEQLIDELKNVINDAKSPKAPPANPASIKVGVLAQFHGQAYQEQTTAAYDAVPNSTQHWQRQLMVRRLRILVGGALSPATSIFFESDATNIGKTTATGAKSGTVSMYVQDAQIQHTVAPEFGVIAGLQLVGIARGGLQSAASLMGLNYGAYQFVASGPLDNTVGRDVGVNMRGLVSDERFEYRLGVFSGRNVNMHSPLRVTARLNYNFLDREKGYFYAGTGLGKSTVLAVGGGVDVQGSYRGYAVDGFYDGPFGAMGAVTVLASYSFLDGGGSDADSTVFTGLIPRQHVALVEAGYLFRDLQVQPYVRYERQAVDAVVARQVGATAATLGAQNTLRSGERFGAGVNYFFSGHATSVKLLFERVYRGRWSVTPGKAETVHTDEATLQLQYFFY